MSSIVVYLDESGDLGWSFDQPYRQGGSSRYLTIAALVVVSEKRHLPKRVVRDCYKKFGWNPQRERKWPEVADEARDHFARASADLVTRHPDVKHFTITVRKQNVLAHIRGRRKQALQLHDPLAAAR